MFTSVGKICGRSIASCAVLVAGACQVYTPVAVAPTIAGSDVRVTLTERGTATLYGPLGSGATQLEGKVRGVTDSSFSLAVTQVRRLSGVEETWNGEPFTLKQSDIATVEHKQTSVTRSLLLAGGVIGGAILAGRLGTGDQTGTLGGTSPPTQR